MSRGLNTNVSSSASSSFISEGDSPQQTTGDNRSGKPRSPGFSLNDNRGIPRHVDPMKTASPSSRGGGCDPWLENVVSSYLCCEICREVVVDPVQVFLNDPILACRKCARTKKYQNVKELPAQIVAVVRQLAEKCDLLPTESPSALEDISRNEEGGMEKPLRSRVPRLHGRPLVDGSVASPSNRELEEDPSTVFLGERNERNQITSLEIDERNRITAAFFKKSAPKRNGPTSRDIKVEADKYYESANYTAALELYTKAIALQKEDNCSQAKFLYGNRSAAYFMTARYKECMEDCLTVFKMEPTNYKLLLRAALSAVSLGDLTQAVSILESVPAKERENQEQIITKLSEYRTGLDLYKKAERAFGTSEGDEYFRMLVAQFPNIVPFRQRFAESLFKRKQYLRTVETLEVVAQSARTPELLRLMADSLYLSGFEHFDRARKCLSEVAQYDDECRKLLEEIDKIDEMKLKGNNNFTSKKFKEAVGNYTTAINMAQRNEAILRILYCNRAAAYKEIGSYREGVEDCTKAIAIAPEFFKAYARRARCHIQLGDNFAAVRDFKKALSIEKTDRELERELRHAENALAKEAEKEKDYYYQLGLTKNCTDRDIKLKYRELSLRWHPDKCVGLDALEKERAEHKFKIISEAYGTLSDPTKRREYDWKQDRERLTRPAGYGFTGFGTAAHSNDNFRGHRYRAKTGDTW